MNVVTKRRTKATDTLPKPGDIHNTIKANFHKLLTDNKVKTEEDILLANKQRNRERFTEKQRLHNHSVQVDNKQEYVLYYHIYSKTKLKCFKFLKGLKVLSLKCSLMM